MSECALFSLQVQETPTDQFLNIKGQNSTSTFNLVPKCPTKRPVASITKNNAPISINLKKNSAQYCTVFKNVALCTVLMKK